MNSNPLAMSIACTVHMVKVSTQVSTSSWEQHWHTQQLSSVGHSSSQLEQLELTRGGHRGALSPPRGVIKGLRPLQVRATALRAVGGQGP